VLHDSQYVNSYLQRADFPSESRLSASPSSLSLQYSSMPESSAPKGSASRIGTTVIFPPSQMTSHHSGCQLIGSPTAGAFADSINGVAETFVIAGTLYAGTEMVGITAGEAGNPRQAVPRAIRQVFWRILIFYVGMMFFIGILIPWNDKRLLSKGSKPAKSPLTIALSDAGINAGASIINAVIVVAVISAGNSSLYVSSRTMLFLARNGKAPKILGMVNKAGVPWVALLFSNIVACIAFLSVSKGGGAIYDALITLSGVTTFIVWRV